MKTRTMSLAIATLAALSPALSNASPEKASVKACAAAFAATVAATAPGYKLDYRSGYSDSMSSTFYPADYTFSLEARDPKTGAAIARAVCSADSRGKVTSLSAVPLNANPASTD
jgi:hypothetical protein